MYIPGLVSGVLDFTSAYHRTLRTSKNAAELAEVSQLAMDESSEFDNFSYGKRKKTSNQYEPRLIRLIAHTRPDKRNSEGSLK